MPSVAPWHTRISVAGSNMRPKSGLYEADSA